ncbi:MAG TPA: multifunctional CCA tRNA nucleotidyl transferase/2'3'-cyclic phosphodiesterase/2'nucleotidase/phosphatase [Gammaproteobacteria bacterium]|nr:multifunctional CCA tRNA nucleotidyl transferase/2'3'-cyclic phosphodiesterase/2'nucleotidase/phosphatase [Gammaproteobacteria bacterium]
MKTYLVGGAVRDRLLGLPVRERDWVVVGATPEQMLELGYTPVGKDFPVFLHPETKEEYALARTERKQGHGYKGFEFHATPDVSLEEDLRRRDLTINAMAQTPEGEIIDPFGGREDLALGRLRHISPAFAEDPVRILRTARFAARFAPWGFTVTHGTNALMRRMVAEGEVDHLVPERVWTELDKALATGHPHRFFTVLHGCHALERLFPALEAQWPRAGGHSGQLPVALEQLARVAEKEDDPQIRFAALLAALEGNTDTRLHTLETLCKDYRIPKAYCRLARLAIEREQALQHEDAQSLLEAMEASSALRDPTRWHKLLALYQALGRMDPARAARLEKARREAAGIQAANLGEHGLSGPALGQAIRAHRRDAIARALDT